MSTRTLAAVVMVVAVGAACGAKPPEPLEPIAPRMRPVAFRSTPAAPVFRKEPLRSRPAFEPAPLIPDPTYVLRWPLGAGVHPELRPQFDIAGELAEPGIDWTELCRMGAHNRLAGNKLRDQLGYLRAWCKVAQHDHDGALAELVKVRGTPVRGLGASVRTDIVNIVLDGDANGRPAATLLAKHRLLDPDLLDLLAATYQDLGALDAANDMNERAISNDNLGNLSSSCRRIAKRVVLDADHYRNLLRLTEAEPGKTGKDDADAVRVFPFAIASDPTCIELERELMCWLQPATRCEDHLKAHGIDPKYQKLLAAHAEWPSYTASREVWYTVVEDAIAALPLEPAFDYAVSALENAVLSDCEEPNVGVDGRIIRIAAEKPPERLQERVRVLFNAPSELCGRK